MAFQKTLAEKVSLSGRGTLDKRKIITLNFIPAKENSGIIFRRTDINKEISATIDNVINDVTSIFIGKKNIKYRFISRLYNRYNFIAPKPVQLLCFLLENISDTFNYDHYNPRIRCVEHLLSSVYALGIDNLIIEVNSDETPVFDDSVYSYIRVFNKAGIIEQSQDKRYLTVSEEYLIKGSRDEYIKISPSDKLIINYKIDFPAPIGKDEFEIEINPESFTKELSYARSFSIIGFKAYLKKWVYPHLNVNLNNTLIYKDGKYLNKPGFEGHEAVRHKIIDFMGDLALLGCPVKARFDVYKGAHHWDIKMVKFLRKLELYSK